MSVISTRKATILLKDERIIPTLGCNNSLEEKRESWGFPT